MEALFRRGRLPPRHGLAAPGTRIRHTALLQEPRWWALIWSSPLRFPQRTDSPKKRMVKGGVDLHKNLAWESAFFNSEGVLYTEELGIIEWYFPQGAGF